MGKQPLPLRQPTDPLHIVAAINWAETLGLQPRRCSAYHLKVGPWNLFTTGRFYHDGDTGWKGFGLPAFKVAVELWLEQEGLSDAVKS
jgi:hypothetical protein